MGERNWTELGEHRKSSGCGTKSLRASENRQNSKVGTPSGPLRNEGLRGRFEGLVILRTRTCKSECFAPSPSCHP